MGIVFVSYRRADAAGQAALLAASLRRCFTRWQVFIDAEGIGPGPDFPVQLEAALTRASALVVVIGKNWLTAADEAGNLRLANENDWVRREVALALKREILVIPAYVDGASQLKAADLPAEISRLADKPSIDLRPSTWTHDSTRVVRAVRRVLLLNCWTAASIAVLLLGLTAAAYGFRNYFPPEQYLLKKVSGDGVLIPNLAWNDKEKFVVQVRDLAGTPVYGARVAWRTQFCSDDAYVGVAGKDGLATATNVCSPERPVGTYWQEAVPVADDTPVGKQLARGLRKTGRPVSFTFETPK